jgi:hypothetical protein
MRFLFAIGFVVVAGGLLFSQKTPETGLSKHANVVRKSGSSGSTAVSTNTKATADALAKIEQQRMIRPSQPNAHPTTVSAAPKTAPQNKNKPIKFAYHPPSPPSK